MRETARFLDLLSKAGDRKGVGALLEALGLHPVMENVTGSDLALYGLTGDETVSGLVVAARRGSLVALLVEPAAALDMRDVGELTRRISAAQGVRPTLYLLPDPGWTELTLAMFGPDGTLCTLRLHRTRPLASDLEALEEMADRGGAGVEVAVRIARALDRSRLTRRFFHDFRSARARISGAWSGLESEATRDRDRLALLLLCRLMFLYFLQRRGLLAGNPDYLADRLVRGVASPEAASASADRGPDSDAASLYRSVLKPLFFAALNTRPAERGAAGSGLQGVPYLNGGLFEPHELERRHGLLDLPDEVVRGAVRLLERYRFTTRGAGDSVVEGVAEVGVDPEMLGRVFEELMESDRRGRTGSFYTPAPVVDRVVREALTHYVAGETGDESGARALVEGSSTRAPLEVRERLREVRVLDPACGSGAFLLGALSRLSRVQARLTGESPDRVRRELVGRSLHGVDLLDDAALLCALRLWLALSFDGAEEVEPLPNLDRRIRQGDALVDPLDLGEVLGAAMGSGGGPEPAADPGVRRALKRLGPAAAEYAGAEPGPRARLREELSGAEVELARAWIDALDRRATAVAAELEARAGARDLFGETPPDAAAAARKLAALERGRRELAALRAELEERGAVPFFSFGVHFAEADGFDLILSNPPWIRAHRWPGQLRGLAARRYAVTRRAGWRKGARLAGAPGGVGAQVDLSHLFLERSIRLLAPGGVLGMLVPAKTFRSLYGAGARGLLLGQTELVALEDHGLDQNAVFRADAFTGVVVARRRGSAAAGGAGLVRCTVSHRAADPLRFALGRDDLPLMADDPESPWLIAPPDARAAIRAMQAAGRPLGEHDLRIRRGVMTGANDVLLVDEVRPGLGDMARITARGAAGGAGRTGSAHRYEGWVELSALRPVVRGRDIDAYRYGTTCSVVWCHDDDGVPHPAPRRLARYLERHEERLRGRAGWRPGMPSGAVFRLSPELARPKVAWKDLADNLRAVALPATVRWHGQEGRLVPLNTVYFIGCPEREALVLTALFNSLPVRTFCRAIAERAKDARFRFFAWIIALIPLPAGWRDHPAAERLRALSVAAHEAEGMAGDAEREVDRLVAGLYGLDAAQVEALSAFDRWLGSAP